MRYIRGHLVTILSVVFVALGMAWAVHVQVKQSGERSERITQVNTLACALRSDAIELIGAVKSHRAHPLPGDAEIIRSKQKVIYAVDYLTPFCPSPKGSP